jgi:DNA-binding NtrC family response regulator
MKRVLIVEDDVIVAWDYKHIVSSGGYDADVALTVESALSRIEAYQPHAAVMDSWVRRRSTEPVAKKLEAQNIPYVMCAAPASWTEWARPVAAFNKPCTPEKLIQAIKNAIG